MEDESASTDNLETTDTMQPTRVSFLAVGDNIPETNLGRIADLASGVEGDGLYDYSMIFDKTKDYIQAADLACINQEVTLGGEELGIRGWPSFNVPDEIADAVVDAGFDLVGTANNHAYDWGRYDSLENSTDVWGEKDVIFAGTGTASNPAARVEVHNGELDIAFLNYTYGVNGFSRSDVPGHAINFLDEDQIREDVAEAKEKADVVIVSAHWGIEKDYEPSDEELEYAQLFADLGVDLVIGSHPHVIQPMEWVEGKDGNQTLVVYSLGDFASWHAEPYIGSELGGMFTCIFVRDPESGEVSIEDIVWHPTVNHTQSDGEYATVYLLKDYTDELAQQHRYLSTIDGPVAQLRDKTSEIMGDSFEIDM